LFKGCETFVGNKATLLSGGQKRHLAIARAVIGNPPILIFDEVSCSGVKTFPFSDILIGQGSSAMTEIRTIQNERSITDYQILGNICS
jgi:ABC-type multidrug transport system fused ATPase/permease subunit